MSQAPGERIAHYRILAPLGAGGMGAVHRAHDERLGREVALKVLLAADDADPAARARLMREAQTAAALNHPNITHIYEVGEDHGRLYFAMELVEGRTLRDTIPRGGLPVQRVLALGLEIADALAYAHEHGVIHRDLKSTNVMLDAHGRVKVLDFGLAKRLPARERADAATDLSLTSTGTVMGTPNHLPPEVLLGSPADTRSDVWALGLVLYEMASGRVPFDAGTMHELANAIVNAAPPPLGGRVPAGLEAVIARCLEKQPARRYVRGGEVRAALEALSGARPRSAGVPRAAWIAAGVAAVALAAALWLPGALRGRWGDGARAPRIESLAVLPLANLSGDPAQEYFADGMTEELITDLAPIPALKVISRTSVMRFKGSTLPLRDIARALDVDAVVEGSVLRAGDRVRITAQLVEASSDHHLWARSFERDFIDVLTLQSEVAREIAREIQIQVTPQMATRLARHGAVHPEAYDGYLKGRFEVSQVTDQGLRRGIAHFERAVELDPSDARYSAALADAYLVLVQLIGTMPQREGMEKVKEYARRALAADGNSAEAHTSMAAGLYFGDWNWPEAERHVRRALELNPGYTTAHLIHAVMLTTAGRIAEATAENARALELDPLSLICHWNAGTGLYAARRYDESLALARRAAELFPGSPLVHNALLGISEQLGDYPAALDLIERGLLEEDGGKAVAAELRRRYQAEGPPGYWRGLRHYFDAWPPERRRPLERLAAIHAHLGEVARAMDCLERAFAEHSGDMLFLGVDPAYDPLRSDPRFQALVRRVGIPQSAAGVAPRSRPRGRRSGARAARPRPADPAAERPDAPTRRG